MIAIKTVLTAVKIAKVRSPAQTADTTAHWRVVTVLQPGGRIYEQNIPMYERQRVDRCGTGEGEGSPWKRKTRLLEGRCLSPSTSVRIANEVIHRYIHEPERRQANKTNENKICTRYSLLFSALIRLETHEGCMGINTYAVVVSIGECPVRVDVVCVAVVRIKLPTPFTRQSRFTWDFLLSERAKRQHT